MGTIMASEAKRKFGEVMDEAQREPVRVQSHGRDKVVILAAHEFDRMTSRLRQLEDDYWAKRADMARENGMLSPEETADWLRSRIDSEEE